MRSLFIVSIYLVYFPWTLRNRWIDIVYSGVSFLIACKGGSLCVSLLNKMSNIFSLKKKKNNGSYLFNIQHLISIFEKKHQYYYSKCIEIHHIKWLNKVIHYLNTITIETSYHTFRVSYQEHKPGAKPQAGQATHWY